MNSLEFVHGLAADVVAADRVPTLLRGGPDSAVLARVRLVMVAGIEAGMQPLEALRGLSLRADGTLAAEIGHLAALLSRTDARVRFRFVRRSRDRVWLEWLAREPDAPRAWWVRCDGDCAPTPRAERLELKKGETWTCDLCESEELIQTCVPAGWALVGETSWTLERARAEGRNVDSPVWEEHPEGCLIGAALREGRRRFAPDVLPLGWRSDDEGQDEDTAEQVRALEDANKSPRQPKPGDESVTTTWLEQDIKALSIVRGDPVVNDDVRVKRGDTTDDVRRARWSDGTWRAYRYSHRAAKLAGGDDRWIALPSWPEAAGDETASARELVRAAIAPASGFPAITDPALAAAVETAARRVAAIAVEHPPAGDLSGDAATPTVPAVGTAAPTQAPEPLRVLPGGKGADEGVEDDPGARGEDHGGAPAGADEADGRGPVPAGSPPGDRRDDAGGRAAPGEGRGPVVPPADLNVAAGAGTVQEQTPSPAPAATYTVPVDGTGVRGRAALQDGSVLTFDDGVTRVKEGGRWKRVPEPEPEEETAEPRPDSLAVIVAAANALPDRGAGFVAVLAEAARANESPDARRARVEAAWSREVTTLAADEEIDVPCDLCGQELLSGDRYRESTTAPKYAHSMCVKDAAEGRDPRGTSGVNVKGGSGSASALDALAALPQPADDDYDEPLAAEDAWTDDAPALSLYEARRAGRTWRMEATAANDWARRQLTAAKARTADPRCERHGWVLVRDALGEGVDPWCTTCTELRRDGAPLVVTPQLVEPTPEQVRAVEGVVARFERTSAEHGRIARAEKWLMRGTKRQRAARGSEPVCTECRKTIANGGRVHVGVESAPAEGEPLLTPRGIPRGRAHEACVRLLAEGRDPRAAVPATGGEK